PATGRGCLTTSVRFSHAPRSQCCLYSARPHPDLHSLPTRRSSDLLPRRQRRAHHHAERLRTRGAPAQAPHRRRLHRHTIRRPRTDQHRPPLNSSHDQPPHTLFRSQQHHTQPPPPHWQTTNNPFHHL